jgi:catalase (peroxidase I)
MLSFAPMQAFQMPLPAPSGKQPDWQKVRADILKAMSDPAAAAEFASLAWQCASTYRATDYAGGCNGARIRFSPQKDWAGNRGLVDSAIARLEPIQKANPGVSWADLIVLAGTLALEQASGAKAASGQVVASPFSFCPGRTDASSGAGTETLAPRVYPSDDTAFKDNAAVQGITWRDAVALAARPRR